MTIPFHKGDSLTRRWCPSLPHFQNYSGSRTKLDFYFPITTSNSWYIVLQNWRQNKPPRSVLVNAKNTDHMYPMISAFTWFRVFALIYITYHPDSRIREHLKFGGYSRRCQHGSSEIGSHRVRAIFPGPHLSAPPARPCLPSPACGQRGTTPETRPEPVAAREPACFHHPTRKTC
jgi:hypothetical protein